MYKRFMKPQIKYTWEKIMSKCKGCNAEIVWIKTRNGKIMPCNVEKTTIVTEQGETIIGHIPHWATCPKSQNFKEK